MRQQRTKFETSGAGGLQAERLVTLAAGGVLALFGLSRRSWLGLVLAAAGGGLIARSAMSGPQADDADFDAAGEVEPPAEWEAPLPPKPAKSDGVQVEKTVSINAPAAPLYAFWRDFTNLPRFMKHLESVEVLDGGRSHWVAKAPLGQTVAWDAEITDDVENTRIAWQSLPGADISNSGSVEFRTAPGGRGTEVRVALTYKPPAGAAGAVVAKLFGEEPTQQVQDELRRFKQLVEAGEIATIDGQSSSRNKGEGKSA